MLHYERLYCYLLEKIKTIMHALHSGEDIWKLLCTCYLAARLCTNVKALWELKYELRVCRAFCWQSCQLRWLHSSEYNVNQHKVCVLLLPDEWNYNHHWIKIITGVFINDVQYNFDDSKLRLHLIAYFLVGKQATACSMFVKGAPILTPEHVIILPNVF